MDYGWSYFDQLYDVQKKVYYALLSSGWTTVGSLCMLVISATWQLCVPLSMRVREREGWRWLASQQSVLLDLQCALLLQVDRQR